MRRFSQWQRKWDALNFLREAVELRMVRACCRCESEDLHGNVGIPTKQNMMEKAAPAVSTPLGWCLAPGFAESSSLHLAAEAGLSYPPDCLTSQCSIPSVLIFFPVDEQKKSKKTEGEE